MSVWIRLHAQLGTLALDVALDWTDRPLALIGPNGSGKTTLLRIIAGAARAERGVIVVGDRVLYRSVDGIDLPSEERHVGYLPQGHGLFPHLSVRANVAFGLRHLPRAERLSRVRVALETVDLLALQDARPSELSGGQQQTVALVRALVTEPELMLLDEPLAAMDATNRRALRSVLGARLQGRPAIVVTHDARDVAALGADVCVLEEGEIVQRGSLFALRADPQTAFVAEFVGQGTAG